MELSAEQTTTQLRCPHGEAGITFEQAMNLRNPTQIVSAFIVTRLQNGDNILKTGCDNSGLLGYILLQADDLYYTGLEVSPLMHEQAQAFNASFVIAGQADYQLYDGDTLPFTDAAFHEAVSVDAVYFWDDTPFMLVRLCRVLKSGGRLCLSFCEKDFMAKLPFAAHGFILYDAIDIHTLAENLPLHYISEQCDRDRAVSKGGKLVRRGLVDLVFKRVQPVHKRTGRNRFSGNPSQTPENTEPSVTHQNFEIPYETVFRRPAHPK